MPIDEKKPRVLVFSSGIQSGGGSGFEALVRHAKAGIFNAEIVAVASNHLGGGVRSIAVRNDIPFIFISPATPADVFNRLAESVRAEWVVLSGWNRSIPIQNRRCVSGYDPRRTVNIHPGIIAPRRKIHCGGKGMYGMRVHEKTINLYREGRIAYSEISMHFVTERYDAGPVFFRHPIFIQSDDTPASLALRIKALERQWYYWVLNLVVGGYIFWDGRDKATLTLPSWYKHHIPTWRR